MCLHIYIHCAGSVPGQRAAAGWLPLGRGARRGGPRPRGHRDPRTPPHLPQLPRPHPGTVQLQYSTVLYCTVLFCTVPHCLPIAGVRVGGDGDHGAAADQAEVPGVASPGQGAQTPPPPGTCLPRYNIYNIYTSRTAKMATIPHPVSSSLPGQHTV